MRVAAVFVLVGLLASAVPSAQAQALLQAEGCRAPILQLQATPIEFEAGTTYNLLFSIENPNEPPVETVRATITTTTPAGWTATPAKRELTLGPRNVSVDVLAVAAPPRGAGESQGNITLLVTLVCSSGDVQTSASASLVIGATVRGFEAPWPIILAGFLLLIVGVTVLGLRRLRKGIALSCTANERLVAPGKSAKFELVAENRRGKPQKFHFLATGVPEGWQVHLALDEVDFEPGEEKGLWVLVKVPANAVPGDEATVTLRLQNAAGTRESAATVVRARVSGS